MSALLQDVLEVLAAGEEGDLVGGHLLQVSTDQGHVLEILLSSQGREGLGDVGVEVIPLQTELLGHVSSKRLGIRLIRFHLSNYNSGSYIESERTNEKK